MAVKKPPQAATARREAAVTTKRESAARQVPRFQVPFTKKNYYAFGAGIVLLLIGYWALSQPPHDGFLSLTLAPILLVFAYCVVFPYAIITKETPKS